jgi:hypothetical protein
MPMPIFVQVPCGFSKKKGCRHAGNDHAHPYVVPE